MTAESATFEVKIWNEVRRATTTRKKITTWSRYEKKRRLFDDAVSRTRGNNQSIEDALKEELHLNKQLLM